MKYIAFSILGLILGVLSTILVSNHLVVSNADGRTFDNVSAVPHNEVALVLGTPVKMPDGTMNVCFQKRVEAAFELYKAGKVNSFIASGANDEPQAIRDYLVSKGVPEEKIMLDNEGLRTLNSVQTAKKVFKASGVTIVSQKFHNERAIYLADGCKLPAVGYNADMNDNPEDKEKSPMREYLARVKMFLDVLTGATA